MLETYRFLLVVLERFDVQPSFIRNQSSILGTKISRVAMLLWHYFEF